ncbi:MAG TPA: GxxExxY protein [Candidatus Deferrimicrobium sp.]|nr:GxxExxY protein [Candidatus Deferrimicrobium sp.]
MHIDDITGIIINEAMKIHKNLGPGLLESVYETILARMLELRGLKVKRQNAVTFDYEGIRFEEGFRCDLLVNDCVVVELKSTEKNVPVYYKQLLTYLKLMKLEVGLLINFGTATLKEGLQRIVNNYQSSASSAFSASPGLRVNQMGVTQSRGERGEEEYEYR